MKNACQDVFITILGALSSFLTAFILYWVKLHWNFSFYSLMIWFVIPVGAIASGFVAAGGYYLGSRLFNHKPRKIILLNIMIVSFGSYILIHYLDYLFLEVQGKSISNYMSFWEYWKISVTNTYVELRAGRGGHIKIANSIELGFLGYLYAGLQIIGFTFGGVVLYLYLSTRLFCEKCMLYFSSKGSVSRYIDKESCVSFLKKVVPLFEKSNLSDVVSCHTLEGGSKKLDLKLHSLRTDLIIKFCKGCNKHHLGLHFFSSKKSGWDKIHNLSMGVLSSKPLSFFN